MGIQYVGRVDDVRGIRWRSNDVGVTYRRMGSGRQDYLDPFLRMRDERMQLGVGGKGQMLPVFGSHFLEGLPDLSVLLGRHLDLFLWVENSSRKVHCSGWEVGRRMLSQILGVISYSPQNSRSDEKIVSGLHGHVPLGR